MSTAVVWNPACRHHYAGAGHPERPQRFEAVLEAVRRDPQIPLIQAPPADRAALERVHPPAYLDMLEALAARGGGALDGDTFLGPRSLESVLASAGVALGAVEQGLKEGRAFGITRPPGHHALAARALLLETPDVLCHLAKDEVRAVATEVAAGLLLLRWRFV